MAIIHLLDKASEIVLPSKKLPLEDDEGGSVAVVTIVNSPMFPPTVINVSSPTPSVAIIPTMGGGITTTFPGIHNSTGGTGGDQIPLISPFCPWGRYSNTAGTYLTLNLWLDASNYVIDHADFLSTHFGLGHWELDGVVFATLDQSATAEGHVAYMASVGSFTVATSGMHALTYRCLNQPGVHTQDDNYVACFLVFIRGGRVGYVPFPNPFTGMRVSAAWTGSAYGSTLFNPQAVLDGNLADGSGKFSQFFNAIGLPYVGSPIGGSTGFWFEGDVWLDAGTWSFDAQAVVGQNKGVYQLSLNGTPVGTPQPAGTLRSPMAASSAPGNGNIGGSALANGEIDLYDSLAGSPWGNVLTENGKSIVAAAINDALTGIVIATSGWYATRITCVGKNNASTDTSGGLTGSFRRTA